MEDREVVELCARLKRCEARKAEWGNEAKSIKDALAAELDRRGTDTVTAGRFRVERKTYVRSQLDAEALRAKAPSVYALYCVAREVTTLKVS